MSASSPMHSLTPRREPESLDRMVAYTEVWRIFTRLSLFEGGHFSRPYPNRSGNGHWTFII